MFSTNINSTTVFYTLGKEGITKFRSKFTVRHYQENRRRTVLCFKKYQASKFWKYRRAGHHGFIGKLLSHRTQKIPKGYLGCFIKFQLWNKNYGWKMADFTFFRRNFSVPQCQNIGGRTLQFFRILRQAEDFVQKKRFSSIFNDYCLSRKALKNREEPSNVLENLGYRTFSCIRSRYKFSPLKSFLPHSAEKKIVGEPFCVTENSSIEELHA